VLVDQKSRPAARSIRNGCENRRNTIGKHTQRVLEREGCGGRSPCSPSTRFPARAAPRRGGCPAGEAARSGERLKAAAGPSQPRTRFTAPAIVTVSIHANPIHIFRTSTRTEWESKTTIMDTRHGRSAPITLQSIIMVTQYAGAILHVRMVVTTD